MLSITIFLPLLGVALIALLPKKVEAAAKWIALVISLADFASVVWLFTQFKRGTDAMQFVTRLSWIPQLRIFYHTGIDGLSLPLLALSTGLFALAVLASWKVTHKPRLYFAMLLLLSVGLSGVFCALDLVLFYLFWEIVLIPMYFLISEWGGQRRHYAAIKFFLYTFLGSVFMLVGIVALYIATKGSFDIIALRQLGADLGGGAIGTTAWWIFAAFALGFAVKVPIWPLHTWLPDAHVEAPTAASVLLAGIMLKMGLYGFLRIALPILPQAFRHWQLIIAILAVISILYGAAVAFAQTDIKKLVAYSSVSHMGFAMLGIAAGTAAGFNGAMAVSISHGLIAGLLFLLVGVVYERTHTREIAKLSGVASAMPRYAAFFSFAGFAAMGVPLLSGFVGEFLTLVGSWGSNLPHILVILAGVGILLGGAYLLWLMQRFIFGKPSPALVGQPDMSAREMTTVLPLAICVVAIGVFWSLLLQYANPIAMMLQKAVGA
ncbi:MAG: NADH-quinone oxidoreductase subunit M [Actinomycetia bacterium]|nr:NADH-quinone oxidoreductase subunit M [Actinomycetes bacterium]